MTDTPLFDAVAQSPAIAGEILPPAFDYSTLPADVAKEARAIASRIRDRNKQVGAAIIETGRDLIQIKEKLGHGNFGPWLQAEFGLAERSAQNYMRAAAEFGEKTAIVADLPPTAIYALASPSAPEPARKAIIERLEAGERIGGDAVRSILQQARHDEKEAREAAKLTPEAKKRRQQLLARRRAEQEQHRAEWEEAEKVRNDRAAEVAAIIAEKLGPDLHRVMDLAFKTNWHTIGSMLSDIRAKS